MKQRILTISFVLLIVKNTNAQFIYGAKSTALANATVALKDAWSINNNAAGADFTKSIYTGIAYENRFSISELNSQSALIGVPVNNYVFGSYIQRYGIQEFRNTKFGFSLTKAFSNKISAAVKLNYHHLHIENLENESAFSVDCGFQLQVFPKLRLGTHLANPNQISFKRIQDQNIESHIKFGAVLTLNDKLFACSEIEKSNLSPMDYKMGLDYQIALFLALRGGFSVNTFKQYGGFGLNYKSMMLDFAISSHKSLGYSPQLAIGYEF